MRVNIYMWYDHSYVYIDGVYAIDYEDDGFEIGIDLANTYHVASNEIEYHDLSIYCESPNYYDFEPPMFQRDVETFFLSPEEMGIDEGEDE
jgi:hypothetical protein